MRTLIYFSFLCFFQIQLATAQRVPKVKPLIVKATSTECNVCGMHFWDDFRELKQIYTDEAVVMAVHPLVFSNLYNSSSEEFVDNLSVFWGTPTLYLNGEMSEGFWLIDTRDFVETVQERQVVAYPFIDFSIEENTLDVKVETQFFKDLSRPHYLAIYVLEDDVRANQSNRSLDELHSNILRTHIGESVMGTLMSEEEITANQIFINEFSTTLDTSWAKENIKVSAVIYVKNGEQFSVVNGETATSPSLSTSVNELEAANVQLTASPTIMNEQASIEVNLPAPFKDLTLNLVNSLGQTVHSLYTGDLPKGVHTFNLQSTNLPSSGIYFLMLRKGESTLIEKIVVR